MKKSKLLFLLVTGYWLLVTALGCGYTTRAYIGPYRTIYIAPFKNSINIANIKSDYANYINYYPLLESTITQEVVDRFIFDGNLKVVKEKNADVVIRGELTSYDRTALTYAENNEDVTKYRITLWVNFGLYNRDGNVIWKKDSFAGDTTYFITGSLAKTEKQALDDAISDLVRRIVEAVVEAW